MGLRSRFRTMYWEALSDMPDDESLRRLEELEEKILHENRAPFNSDSGSDLDGILEKMKVCPVCNTSSFVIAYSRRGGYIWFRCMVCGQSWSGSYKRPLGQEYETLFEPELLPLYRLILLKWWMVPMKERGQSLG